MIIPPLYPHQELALEKLSNAQDYALLLDLGLGKSRIIIEDLLRRPNVDLLIVAPAGVFRNWSLEIFKYTEPNTIDIVYWKSSGNKQEMDNVKRIVKKSPKRRAFLMNVEALSSVKLAKKAVSDFLDSSDVMMVIDECFPAGTKIKTPEGEKNIEELTRGNYVIGSNGPVKIKKTHKRKNNEILEINLSNGRKIEVTKNHPFFTDLGWVSAINLVGRYIYDEESLSELWKRINCKTTNLLQQILCSEQSRIKEKEVYTREKCKVEQDLQESTMSSSWLEQRKTVATGIQGQTQSDCSRTGKKLWWEQERWEWKADSSNAATIVRYLGGTLDLGICSRIGWEASWLSHLLQIRSSMGGEKIGDRMRWSESQLHICAGERSEENRQTNRIRVESITLKKLRNPIDVYDLTLEGCPHFFAGDVLVHNSTKIRGYNSARTKTVIDLGQKAKYRRILSGLITPKSPMDLYSQFQFLNWRILGYRNFFSFRARYAITKRMSFGGRKFEQIVGYRNIEELQEKIAPYSYRVLKKDCLSLPEKIYLERAVELSPEQQKIYKELAHKAVTVLQGGEFVTSTTAIDMLQRLHAVTYGHVRDDTGEIRNIDAGPRDQQLLEAIEESNGKVIIWANFRHTLARLIKLLKEEYGEETVVDYWGNTTAEDRVKAVDRFQNDSSCRVFVSNPSTGGMGITLTEASTVIYYANSFDLEHRMQSEDRAHRIGQKNSVVYVDLVSKGTIDEKILKALRNKINLAATITGESARDWIR